MKKFILFILTSIFLSQGYAQFAGMQIIDPATSGITEVCTGDINNDGRPDIIVSKAYGQKRVSYYLNEGNLNFGEEHIVTDEYFFYQVVASADFNSDGFDDIVTFGAGNQNNIIDLKLFINNSGNFSTPITLDTGLNADNQVSCSDIDNDGDIDIVADDDISIRVYKNDGNGNFSPPDIVANYDEYYTFDISDFNADGYKDIVCAGAGHISILWNDADGTFPDSSFVDNPLFGLPFTVRAGDFDNDGDNDFALWIAWIDKLVMFTNDGTGNFTITQEIETINLNVTLGKSDVDLDGDLDLLSATNQSSSVIWFENDGTGYFSESKIIHQFAGFESIESVFPADLDSDGDEEVIWGAVSGPLAINENITITVSVNEISMNGDLMINIFPNPATDHIAIKSDNTIREIIITDITGKAVIKKMGYQKIESLDISSLKNGIYFVSLKTDIETNISKFVKK